MMKQWGAIASVLLLSATAAGAAGWADHFKTLDKDGSGTISRVEWEANYGSLDLGNFTPTFAVMDSDNSNSIDEFEWADAENIKKAAATSCREITDGSWCPCQNNPDDPKCH